MPWARPLTKSSPCPQCAGGGKGPAPPWGQPRAPIRAAGFQPGGRGIRALSPSGGSHRTLVPGASPGCACVALEQTHPAKIPQGFDLPGRKVKSRGGLSLPTAREAAGAPGQPQVGAGGRRSLPGAGSQVKKDWCRAPRPLLSGLSECAFLYGRAEECDKG